MSILLASGLASFSAIHFLIGFIVLICVLAIVIILGKWLIGLTGLAIPPPLMMALGIILFLALFLWLLQFSGLWGF